MFYINERIRIPEEELIWSYARSGGPGGQNVNKVSSKTVLRWQLVDSPSVPDDVKIRLREAYRSRITVDGELVIMSQRFRDQGRNRLDCLEKLRSFLELASVPPKFRKKSKPGRGAKERRLAAKRHRSGTKQNRQLPVGD